MLVCIPQTEVLGACDLSKSDVGSLEAGILLSRPIYDLLAVILRMTVSKIERTVTVSHRILRNGLIRKCIGVTANYSYGRDEQESRAVLGFVTELQQVVEGLELRFKCVQGPLKAHWPRVVDNMGDLVSQTLVLFGLQPEGRVV